MTISLRCKKCGCYLRHEVNVETSAIVYGKDEIVVDAEPCPKCVGEANKVLHALNQVMEGLDDGVS